MKICIFTYDDMKNVTGVGRHTYHLAKRLSKDSEVTILFSSDKYEEYEQDKIKFISIKNVYTNSLKIFFFQYAISTFLKKNKRNFDKIIFQETTGFLYLLFNNTSKTQTVFHHSHLEEFLWNIRKIELNPIYSLSTFPLLFSFLLQIFSAYRAKEVITVSNYSKRDLIKCGIDPNKILVDYNITLFNNSQKNKKHSNNVLYTGALLPRKGIDTLLKAIKIINQSQNNFRFFIIGDGPLKKWCLNYIRKNSLSNCKILGRVNDEELKKLYSTCSIFISPSYYEGFGIVLLEAQKFGLKIIASDLKVFRELFGDKIDYFRRENHRELAIKIINIK